jgi:hypothetical protein
MAEQFTLIIRSGKNRFGEKEGFESIEIKPGDTLSMVSKYMEAQLKILHGLCK